MNESQRAFDKRINFLTMCINEGLFGRDAYRANDFYKSLGRRGQKTSNEFLIKEAREFCQQEAQT